MTYEIEWAPYAGEAIPCDSAELDAFEAEVGASLPQDYRDLLTAHAGEAGDLETLALEQGSTTFGAIYYLDRAVPNPAAVLNAWVTLKSLRHWLGEPDAALAPIAWNHAKGEIVYDLRKEGEQRIRFMDLYCDPSEPGAVQDIAGDIAELLSKLTP